MCFNIDCSATDGFITNHANQSPVAVPVAVILLREEKPSQEAYIVALDALNERTKKHFEVEIYHDRVINVMADMEEPLRIAIKHGWKNCLLHICFFHHVQALFVNLGKKNLFSLYRSDGKNSDYEFYKFGRCYMCLALIHPALVIRAWNLLHSLVEKFTPDEFMQQMCNFVEYHKNFYMKNVAFIKSWNVYR